jgi:gas vesicle protein
MNMNEFTYFGLGAVVGVATAVLFAPRAGSETREYLRSKAENGTDYVTSHASDVRDAASQVIKRGKKVVQHQTENFTAAVDAGVQTYREAAQTTP